MDGWFGLECGFRLFFLRFQSVVWGARPGLGSHAKDHSDSGSGGHGKGTPERHTQGPLDDPRTASRGPKAPKRRKADQGRARDKDRCLIDRRYKRDDQRNDGARGKGHGRDDRRLNRLGHHHLGNAKLIARMRAQGVLLRQLNRNLPGQIFVQPAPVRTAMQK